MDTLANLQQNCISWQGWISLFSSLVTSAVMVRQYIWAKRQDKQRRKDDLKRRLEHILEMTVTYPYLESARVAKGWEKWKQDRGGDDETFLRYDQFCNILFNYLEDVFFFFEGDKKKIESFVDVKSWVRMHRQNWEHPLVDEENVDGYDEKFRRFIDSYLK